ncbi:hypothetical protein DXG01_016996 [Tephrocybe rancida]|nr:hypothetical protein DXG01_016996 [Tephrocybe rancida]
MYLLHEIFSENVTDESTAIYEYLLGKLTVETVAQRLVEVAQSRSSPSLSFSNNIANFFDSYIVVAAEELPETHDTLASLVGALKQQTEEGIVERGLNYALWERSAAYGDPDVSTGVQQENRDSWTNLNHFAALIHKAGFEDLSLLAIDTLSFAWRRKEWRINTELKSRFIYPNSLSRRPN